MSGDADTATSPSAPPDDATQPWNAGADGTAARSAAMEFPSDLSAPRVARSFVATAARSWGLGDVGSVAELLVSELVTNALEHGVSGGWVRVEALPAGLRVAVTDRGGGLPVARDVGTREATGRGLAIVDALSRWWGVESSGSGKTVWFEVDDGGDLRAW